MREIKITGIRIIPKSAHRCFISSISSDGRIREYDFQMFEMILEKIQVKQKLHGKLRLIRFEIKKKSFWKKFIESKHHEKFLPIQKFIEQRDLRLSAKLKSQFEKLHLNYHPTVCKIWLCDGYSTDAVYDFHYNDKIDNILKGKKKKSCPKNQEKETVKNHLTKVRTD